MTNKLNSVKTYITYHELKLKKLAFYMDKKREKRLTYVENDDIIQSSRNY